MLHLPPRGRPIVPEPVLQHCRIPEVEAPAVLRSSLIPVVSLSLLLAPVLLEDPSVLGLLRRSRLKARFSKRR
jgi:hypothetical protein